MTNREAFQMSLPRYMERAGISQSDLAEAVGVSKSTVHCWVHGKAFPRIDVMQRIADVLGCETDDLTYPARLRFDISQPQRFHSDVIKIIDDRIDALESYEEMRRLWQKASPAAKKAALAVLKSMAENE